jgi:hypothetical protein
LLLLYAVQHSEKFYQEAKNIRQIGFQYLISFIS